jgi:hypothetical protein
MVELASTLVGISEWPSSGRRDEGQTQVEQALKSVDPQRHIYCAQCPAYRLKATYIHTDFLPEQRHTAPPPVFSPRQEAQSRCLDFPRLCADLMTFNHQSPIINHQRSIIPFPSLLTKYRSCAIKGVKVPLGIHKGALWI